MSEVEKGSFRVAFARYDRAGFDKVLKEHSITLSGLAINDLIGLNFLVMCTAHIPEWVVQVKEILLPKVQGGAIELRVGEVRSVCENWGTPEVSQAFNEVWYDFKGHQTILTEFPSDAIFKVGLPVQLRANTNARGALSLEAAVLSVAETYAVKPSQVKIVISSPD